MVNVEHVCLVNCMHNVHSALHRSGSQTVGRDPFCSNQQITEGREILFLH